MEPERPKVRQSVIIGSALFVFSVVFVVGFAVTATRLADWVAFDLAADRVVGRAPGEIYQGLSGETTPFLYPPYVLLLVLPLALFGSELSYGLIAVTSVAAMTAGVWFASGTILNVPRDRRVAAVALCLLSVATVGNLLSGQLGCYYVLFAGLALRHWHRGDRNRGVGWLTLMFIKPNIAIVPLVLVVIPQKHRAAAIIVSSGAFLALVGVLMGPDLWSQFLDSIGEAASYERGNVDVAANPLNLSRQPTLLAFLRQLPFLGTTGALAIWLPCAFLGFFMLAKLWARNEEIELIRLFGVTLLFVVAANPRLYFYDWAIVAIAFTGWYCAADSYSSTRLRKAIGYLIATLLPLGYTVSHTVPYALFALLTTVWCGLEIADLSMLTRRRNPNTTSSPSSGPAKNRSEPVPRLRFRRSTAT